MKQNNRKNTWKAVVVVMLVMVSLFAVSTAVSAGVVESIFNEKYSEIITMLTSSNDGGGEAIHVHKKISRECDEHGEYESFICQAPEPYKCASPGCVECQNG